MSSKDGIVHLRNLPGNMLFVKFLPKIQKNMVEKALEFFKNEDQLAKQLNSTQGTVNDFKNSRFKSTNLDLVKNLTELLVKNGLLEFSLDKLEKQIQLIKTKVGFGIKNPEFPINFNCIEGAQIISAFLFDGGIREDLRPFYVNNEKYLIDKTIKNLKKIIGDISYTKDTAQKTTFIDFTPVLGIILSSGLNSSIGKRVQKDPSIPDFIMNGDSKIKKIFLQQAFDDEGSVSYSKGNRIRLTQYNSENKPPKRLNQLKKLIEEFNIRVSGPYHSNTWVAKNSQITHGFQLQISNIFDIKNFAKNIGFSLEKNKIKLKLLTEFYKFRPMFKKGTLYDEVLKACQKLSDEGKTITNKNIANKLKRTESHVKGLTRKMVNQNILKIIKERNNLGGRKGATSREFDIK